MKTLDREFRCLSFDRQTQYRVSLEDESNIELRTDSTSLEKSDGQPFGELLVFQGFVDLQVNGYQGVDMSDPHLSGEDAERFCRRLAGLGVTRFLPTVTTNSHDSLCRAMKNLHQLSVECELFGKMIMGIHLEGPFISPIDGPRGAHPLTFCRPCDREEFLQLQDAANGLIRIVTLSPEYPSSNSFIKSITSERVIASIGHTAATPEQIRAAIDHGASMATHLGNGMHKEIARHPNYLWELIAADEIEAGLISDGVHLPASVLKTIIRAKSPDRCFLVSDSTSLSGMPVGRYDNSALGDVEVTEDQRLVIAGQRILNAGAYLPLKSAIPIAVRDAEIDFPTAIRMASENPLRTLSRQAVNPQEIPSQKTTFVAFTVGPDHSMEIKMVVIDGRLVFYDPVNQRST